MIAPHISSERVILAEETWADTIVVPPVVLKVSVPESDYTEWCWAAVGLGIAKAYGTAGKDQQCDVATRVWNPKWPAVVTKDCCQDPAQCNAKRFLPPVLGAHHARTRSKPGHQLLSYVKTHIDAGHPLCVRIQREYSSSGHFVVISGYHETATQAFLWICDPDRGSRKPYPFEQFRTNYEQDGSWHLSYETRGGTVPFEEGVA